MMRALTTELHLHPSPDGTTVQLRALLHCSFRYRHPFSDRRPPAASPSAISPSWTASYQALPRRCGTPTTNRAQPWRDNQLGSSSTVTAELVC